ncbi:hypothetical protein DFR70_102982 [Nocardia tenerifensis]|uniref:Uncharacterized protein n=1 Tax=Nocardia tenerifensis TaxID=228006 RepID=A0A318K8S3_9NOCA|nr:hypothetical protein [Nocardia tenerifensis]PXX69293.1 hypothetical protein DFR70_102982 [Nocardia tenerifensis]
MSTFLSVMDTVNFVAASSGSSDGGDSLSGGGSSTGSLGTGLDLAKVTLKLLSLLVGHLS